MRHSSLILLIVIFITTVLLFISVMFNLEQLSNYCRFWFVVLLPFLFFKIFLPKSKFGKWLNSNIKFKSKDENDIKKQFRKSKEMLNIKEVSNKPKPKINPMKLK